MNSSFIPYGRQQIDEDDIKAVVDVLKSDWLTTGPKVTEFEEAVAGFVGVKYGIAVSSGTAALHAVMYAIGIGPGDEVIVPAMTFAASANCVVYQGGRPVFADVEAETMLINPAIVEQLVTSKTRAIIAVDYAGQPCDYDALMEIAVRHDLILVADGCHALGATYKGRKVGSLAELTVFSFHPVKQIATGEGGMIVTDNEELAVKIRRFRNHGISTDHRQREQRGTWYYEMVDLGFNYRISDIQCALGISQLQKLPGWLARRREIATAYDHKFFELAAVTSLLDRPSVEHAYHLYVVYLAEGVSREKVYSGMRQAGIGVNVHYLPVHCHPFYQERFGYKKGLCPVAEAAYEQVLSLPIWPGMDDDQVARVVREIKGIV